MLNRQITYEEQTLQTLAEQFRRFAEKQCRGISPLYEKLSLGVSRDSQILSMALVVKPGQPAPNIFFGAVHFLILRGCNHPLSHFFPSVSELVADNSEDPFPYLRAFCLQNSDELSEIISTRITQTNEVARCALLLPALFWAKRRNDDKPFHFVDVGASAGLCVIWNKYYYDYGESGCIGLSSSSVHLDCEVRQNYHIQLPQSFPETLSNEGVELMPFDINASNEVLWLEALIWPENHYRRKLFKTAISLAQIEQPKILAGNAVNILPHIIADYPGNLPVFLLFSFSGYQIFAKGRSQTVDFLIELSKQRTIYETSIGHFGNELPRIIFSEYQSGSLLSEQTLAICDTYGTWIQPIEKIL